MGDKEDLEQQAAKSLEARSAHEKEVYNLLKRAGYTSAQAREGREWRYSRVVGLVEEMIV